MVDRGISGTSFERGKASQPFTNLLPRLSKAGKLNPNRGDHFIHKNLRSEIRMIRQPCRTTMNVDRFPVPKRGVGASVASAPRFSHQVNWNLWRFQPRTRGADPPRRFDDMPREAAPTCHP